MTNHVMTMHVPIIALDGPSGSGKGVVANYLSTQYKFHLLDSGALSVSYTHLTLPTKA